MMWTHQVRKIISATRSVLFSKHQITEKQFVQSNLCKCRISGSRSLATTSRAQRGQNRKPSQSPGSSTIKVTNPSSPIQKEELLEELIAGLSTSIYQKNRVYKKDLLRILEKVKEMNFSTKKQGLLLLSCCTELLPDEAPVVRLELAENIWNTIKNHAHISVDHHNEMLHVYIANNKIINARNFLSHMEPVKPNITTYELLLRGLSEAGDLNQASEVIANMKIQNLPATVDVFNSLIICQGKSGNLKNIQEVLSMMTSLKLDRTVETYVALARSLAWNKKIREMFTELNQAVSSGMQFEEQHIMDIVKTLAVLQLYEPVPQVLQYLPKTTLSSPSISPCMQSVTTQLIYQNHPLVALEIYKCLPLPSFGPKDDKGLHGRSLVRDCVRAGLPSGVIYLVTQELMSTGRNPIALQNASEAALQQGKVPLALDLFARMKQLGMAIRPHYFWPVLLHSSKVYGEKGILNILAHMNDMQVKPDSETIMDYILPYVSFTSPQNLMKKFLDTGVSATMVLTPMMVTLLNSGQTRAASEICELFNGKVDVEKVLKPLVKSFLISMDVKSTIHLLEDMSEKPIDENKDWVGRFLCMFVQHKQKDFLDFLSIVKALQPTKLRISTGACDYCLNQLPESLGPKVNTIKEALLDITNEKNMDWGDHFTQSIPHPKQMNEEALKSHLIELEAKGMNTRGVLRKLLQEYCRAGDMTSAKEIVEKCEKEGVFLSAGMRAAIFDMHVKLGELDLAEKALADLNNNSPNFVLDEYKVIDFATLMVYRQKIDKAITLIHEQSKLRKVTGGRNLSMNCWRLLDAVAAKGNHADVKATFETLVKLGYCTAANSLLGPLIRVHLKNNNLTEAVNEYVRVASTYNKTPLKHELLCKILIIMSDGISEDNFITHEKSNSQLNILAQTVLHWNKKVHGAGDVQLTMITALAEVGYKKTLRKMLLEPTLKIHPDALIRRCERFAEEKKIKPLMTLAECARDLRFFEVSEVYDLILDICQRDDKCDKAMDLWKKMQEDDIIPSKKFARNFCALMKLHKREEPSELMMLVDRPQKASSS